jgi:hypothetical protein
MVDIPQQNVRHVSHYRAVVGGSTVQIDFPLPGSAPRRPMTSTGTRTGRWDADADHQASWSRQDLSTRGAGA